MNRHVRRALCAFCRDYVGVARIILLCGSNRHYQCATDLECTRDGAPTLALPESCADDLAVTLSFVFDGLPRPPCAARASSRVLRVLTQHRFPLVSFQPAWAGVRATYPRRERGELSFIFARGGYRIPARPNLLRASAYWGGRR